MKKIKVVATLFGVFISIPISVYLTYVLLLNANVDRLVWFLFIINMPVAIFARIIMELVE